uniref:Uncharacterized protein n=1 Tax=Arundo donax TaxID=35708 RepID=A0A0A9CED8_ARUDO
MGSPCPSFSRLLFPGGDGEAGAVLSSWISSLRPCPCLGGVRSGVGEGPVRVMPAGCGTLAQVLRSCGSCTGVRSPPVCSVVLAEVLGSWCKASERGYVCFVVLWSPELFFLLAASLRDERIKDQVTLGCVPSRCVFTVNSIPFLGTGGYCGSFQSRCAMVLLLIPTLGFSLSSGGRYGVDGFRRPVLCSQILGGPNDLVANVLFSRVHCASLVRPMSSLYPLLMYPYMYLLGYVFLIY